MKHLHKAISVILILIGLYLVIGFIGNVPPMVSGVGFILIGLMHFAHKNH